MATADQVIEAASSHIGISGTDNIFNTWIWGTHVYDPNTYPWCAAFVSYVLIKECGISAQASAAASGIFGQFDRIDDSEVRKGDIVVFNWDGRADTGWCDHVGIVEWSDINGSGLFGTIEGNTGWTSEGEVARCTRNNNSSYFTAFARPRYSGVPGTGGGNAGGASGADSSGGQGSSSTPSGKSKAKWRAKMRGKKRVNGGKPTYTGIKGRPILYLAVGGVGEYQVSDIRHGWWDPVCKYDLKDEENGMAGDNQPIDKVRIPADDVYYQTHNLGGKWNPIMKGLKDTGWSSDDFAGNNGVQQDLIRIWRTSGEQPVYRVFS